MLRLKFVFSRFGAKKDTTLKRAVFLIFLTHQLMAQVSVKFPYNRSVFQRDNSNSGTISVSGFCEKDANKIMAKMTAINGGKTLDWQVLDQNIDNGHYLGTITNVGGWYSLEVRSMKGETVLSTYKIEKVGIGEVFLVCGQSNAQGFNRFNPKPASDDRVNTLEEHNDTFLKDNPTFKDLTKISSYTNIAPRGQGAWCWGELGDKLAAKLGVPVLFFNAAYEGTAVNEWLRSARGEVVHNNYFNYDFEIGFPYNFLRISLNTYCSRFGLRAILWLQGENDVNTPENEYYNSFVNLMDEVNKDTGKDVNWVVSRTSLNNTDEVHTNVTNAQNRVISNFRSVFAGPITDTIQVPRLEGVHFVNFGNGNDGLSMLADGWNNALNAAFFSQSTPIPAKPLIKLQFNNCDNNNIMGVQVPSQYSGKVVWNDSTKSREIRNNYFFEYEAYINDQYGNRLYSPKYNLNYALPQEDVSISSNKSVDQVCDGDSIILSFKNSSNYKSILWSNNAIGNSLKVFSSGYFFAKGVDKYNCKTKESNAVNVYFRNSPPKPSMKVLTKNNVCDGQVVKLRVDNIDFGNQIFWNNGSKNQEIEVSEIGLNYFKAYQKDSYGCISAYSDSAYSQIYPNPETPEIVKSSIFTLAIENTNKTNYQWYLDDVEIDNNASLIVPLNTGYYKAKAFLKYENNDASLTCYSKSSGTLYFAVSDNNFILFPNPSVDRTMTLAKATKSETVTVKLFSTTGEAVFEKQVQVTDGIGKVHFYGVATGQYVVELIGENLDIRQRVIIN